MKSIGDILRQARAAAGKSQADVAKAAGLDPNYLSRIENSHTEPTVETLVRVARGIGVPTAKIMDQLEKARR